MYHSLTHLLPAEDTNGTTLQTNFMQTREFNFVTPVAPILPTMATSVLPTPPITTDSTDFYRHLHPVKTYSKIFKTSPTSFSEHPKYSVEQSDSLKMPPRGENVTVFTLDDIDSPFKTIQPDLSLSNQNQNWEPPRPKINIPSSPDYFHHFHPKTKSHPFVLSDNRMHDIIVNQQSSHNKNKQQANAMQINSLHSHDGYNMKQYHESPKKISMSDLEDMNLFLPAYKPNPNILTADSRRTETQTESMVTKPSHSFFRPTPYMQNSNNRSSVPKVIQNTVSYKNRHPEEQNIHTSYGKQMTVLKNKDLNAFRPMHNNEGIWRNSEPHVLIKAPNPYETVLLRPVSPDPNYNLNAKTPLSSSPLDLDHLVSQMEMESEVNRNLGRSADKMGDSVTAGQ